jgi:hypothetical protein
VLYLIVKAIVVILCLYWALGRRNVAVAQDEMTGGLCGGWDNLMALFYLAAALFVLFVV